LECSNKISLNTPTYSQTSARNYGKTVKFLIVGITHEYAHQHTQC